MADLAWRTPRPPTPRITQSPSRQLSFSATLAVVLGSLAVVLSAPAPASADEYLNTGQCVEGTFHVKHGVTAVHVHAVGEQGTDGFDVTQNMFGGDVDFEGGTGGLGSSVETTIPVTEGMTLYVGVANDGMPGGGTDDSTGGKGGAASWVTDTDPRVNGACKPSVAHSVVIAAGGGGGGGAGSRHQATPGGGGGIEASGGNGGDGAEGIYDGNGGNRGFYSNGSSGGAGGSPGSSVGCSGGVPGAGGTALAGGRGGTAGSLALFTFYDCSQPPPFCKPCAQFGTEAFGGGGGGGGGGLWGGGGGGGADDSGFGAGGGGGSGRSYARNPASYAVTSTRIRPFVTIEAVTSAPAITSADHVTLTRGAGGSFTATATGVDTPYVRFTDPLPNGLTSTSATFADDGSGAGSALLSGTPTEIGVFTNTVSACNSVDCVEQAFTLTVNGSPTFTSPDTNTFVVGSAGSMLVTTTALPAAAITQTGAPAWLTLTDHNDGTATLSGTPPVGAANSYVVTLHAANGIAPDATQALTLKVVTSLVVTPSLVHLVPGNSTLSFVPYRRGFQQQLRAIGTFPDGSTGDVSGFVRWSSSNAGVASLTGSALVTANALGTATVTAATAAQPATASIVVAMPLSITLSPATVSLIGGQSQQFTATGCYASPCASNSSDISANVSWRSINPASVQVSADGLGTAQAGGNSATVFAELYSTVPGNGYAHGEATVTVTHGGVVQVVVTPAGRTVPTRTTVHYHATLVYQDGTLAADSPYVTWTISGIASATIGPAGDAYSPDPGTATVRARFTNVGGGIVDGTTTLTVIRTPSSLVVSPVSGAAFTPLVKGGTRQYKAVAHYTDGSPDVDVTNGVTWATNGASLATVTAGGLVTAKGSTEGLVANILVAYTFANINGGTTTIDGISSMTITVLPPVSITITPVNPPVLHPNQNLQFTATGTYADGSTVTLTNQVTWGTSDFLIGFMNASGSLHTPVGTTHGTVTVFATITGLGGITLHSNNVDVVVTDPLDHVALRTFGTLNPISAGNQSVEFWVEGFDANSLSLGNVTSESTLAISPDGSCDPVAHTCTATVADTGAGHHTVTGTDNNAVHPTTPGRDLVLNHAVTDHIEVTGGSLAITAGQSTAPYHVTSFDAYGNTGDVSILTTFEFLPSQPLAGCTSPSATPTCHAGTAGEHTVRALYLGNTVLLPLWVNASPVLDHLTLSGGPPGPAPSVTVGATTPPYVVTGYDAFGNSGDVTGQTTLSITPDGTCDFDAHTCTPTGIGPHSVMATGGVGGSVTSNVLSLTSVGPPTLAVSFTPSAVDTGDSVVLKFTLTNPNPTATLTGVSFTATIPASLAVTHLDPPCGGGTFSLPAGGIVMSGVTLLAGAVCEFTYIGTAQAGGVFTSTTSGLTSAEGGGGGTASATLNVTGPPILTKSFAAASVSMGSTTPLTFTVTNPNTALALSGIGFTDTLPAGLSFASTTVTGTCGSATIEIAGSTLTFADGALGHGQTCTFSADVSADVLGPQVNTTSAVTSVEHGNGAPAHATVVVTEPLDHFDIQFATLTAGEPGQTTVTALDVNGNLIADYAGHPTLTGDLTASDTGCGAGGAEPCDPMYDLPQFVNGVGTATITAYRVETPLSITVSDDAGTPPASVGVIVNPGAFDHLTLTGGSPSISAGGFTDPYVPHPWDAYGNSLGNTSADLSISPDGTCGLDSCTAEVADTGGSHHTVTGTNAAALHPTVTRSLVVGTGPVEHVTLSGGSPFIVAGTTTDPYVVEGVDLFGNAIGVLPAADATLSIDPEGTCNQVARTCTASQVGAHDVVATPTFTGATAMAGLLVIAGPPDHLVLTPSTSSVMAGAYQAYVATAYDAEDNPLGDHTATTTFTADDGSCVGSSCTATSLGDHTVTGTDGSLTGTATLAVNASTLHHIALHGGSASAAAGSFTDDYVVEGYDAYGNDLGDVTAQATLTVDPEGYCSLAACQATLADTGPTNHVVRAAHPGVGDADAPVVITPGAVDHVALSGGGAELTAGQATAPYQVEGFDAWDNDAGDVTPGAVLSIAPEGTCDPDAHTCSADIPDAPGDHHTVTATYGDATATLPVHVSGGLDHFGFAVVGDIVAGEPTRVRVTAYQFGGAAKEDYAGAPTLTGDLGTSARGCGPTGQTGCDPEYLLEPFNHGVGFAWVTGFSAETGRTLTVIAGAVHSASDAFAVLPAQLERIRLTGGSAFITAGGSTAAYEVRGLDHYGNDRGDVTADSTLTITPNGGCVLTTCSATVAGDHSVRAHDPNAPNPDSSADLLVKPGPVDHLVMTGGSVFVAAGSPTAAFHLEGWDSYNNDVGDVTANAPLSITPNGSCDQTTHTCSATAAEVSGSHHTITATHPPAVPGGISPTATRVITVTPGSPHHIVVTPNIGLATAGGTSSFAATSRDMYDNPIAPVTASTTFTVADGSCTGSACGSTVAGDHTVTGTYGLMTATAVLRVSVGPLHHITLTGGSASVPANGTTAPYTALAYDLYGNLRGDATSLVTLSIAPDGTCDQTAHTCTPTVADLAGSHHTVTATRPPMPPGTTPFLATKDLSVLDNSADLRITKTGPATAVPGTNVTYQLSAQDYGPATADTVTVSDTLPAGTTFISETHPLDWSCAAPAPATTGAYTCTRTSLAVGDDAQVFTLTVHVTATATGQVSNTATVSASTSDLFPANNTSTAVVTQVACGRTITGLYAGDLTLSGTGSTCLRGATVTGKLTVLKGATLVALNAIVGGAVSTSGSGALTFCGSSLRSSVSIAGASGFVLVGDPGDDACAGNTVTGSVSLTGNNAGIDLRSNRLLSSLTADKNKGGGPFPVDTSPVVAANTMSGRLSCKSNTPAPTNDGQPNTAPTKSYQCAGL